MGTTLTVPFDGIDFDNYTVEVDGRLNELELNGVGSSNTVVGEIISGWIEPVFNTNDTVDDNLDVVDVVVRANTKVLTSDGETITLSEQIFNLDRGTYGNSLSNKMYCDREGVLYFTPVASPELPIGDFILLAQSSTFYNASLGTQFGFKTTIHSNNLVTNRGRKYLENAKPMPTINFDDFGGSTDGLTDINTQALRMQVVSESIAKLTWEPVSFFSDGVYITDGSVANGLEQLNVRGQSQLGVIFRSSDVIDSNILTPAVKTMNVKHLDNVTLDEIKVIFNEDTYMDYVKFTTNVNDANLYLCSCLGENTTITNTVLDYTDTIYIGIYIDGFTNLKLGGNICNQSMLGTAHHGIRVNVPKTKDHTIVINEKNKVFGGITGIFLASSRVMPIIGAVIEDNILMYQKEESIGLDGFGNNSDLCPVICNGTISAVDNTGLDGRLKVTADMVYHNGADVVSPENTLSTISLRDDWTNFYYSFSEGSGREGSVVPIHSYDSVNNTLTLDVFTLATDVTIGGNVGVQSGFFDCKIKRNLVIGTNGLLPDTTKYYGRGISLWLNIFNCVAIDNRVVGCATGIYCLGGFMLSTYKCLAYNNTIERNNISECATFSSQHGSIALKTEGSDTFSQFGNRLINNNVYGGKIIEIHNQRNLIYDGNNFEDTVVEFKYSGNTLPIASSNYLGKTQMLITDDPATGLATDITYHKCKLVSGSYLWVEI